MTVDPEQYKRLRAALDMVEWQVANESAHEIFDASTGGPAEVVSVAALSVILDELDPGWRERAKR